MELGGIANKITGNVDKVGIVAGFYLTANHKATAWYGKGQAIKLIQEVVNGIIEDPHLPDIGAVLADTSVMKNLQTGIMVAVAGYALDALNMAGKWGGVIQKAGIGVAEGALLFGIVDHAGLEHSGGDPAGQPYGGHDGYPRGAGYSPLGRRNGGYFTMPTVPPRTPTLPTILPASPRP